MVALAVSLDIVNAFNSLPWRKIIEFYQAPPYLQGVPAGGTAGDCLPPLA
jgi:hypothetical protein